MKSVLISIQPKWCELIASGKKTVEVRKTRPKLKTPFKCYIYCTVGGIKKMPRDYLAENFERGKVIGEFVCDEIYPIKVHSNYAVQNWMWYELSRSCLSLDEVAKYVGANKTGYGWHISDLVIYDKPRELYEFHTFCTKFYDGEHCEECEYFIDGRGYEYDESDCGCDGLKPIKRPFQSWGYVEE
ncbi:MAG: ASCH domain-containing protein [Clostridia bacterium]|nr:ASCH domain-containing protein [Clostridia bacterium]